MKETGQRIFANIYMGLRDRDLSRLDRADGMLEIAYSLDAITKSECENLSHEITASKAFCGDNQYKDYYWTGRASEYLENCLSDEGALENRKRFVRNLGWLLSQTRDGVLSCDLEVPATNVEHVVIRYMNGAEKRVNVSCDSFAAIIRDVAAHFQ